MKRDGTVLNGQTSKAWPESHLQNKIMFRLPRPMNANDEIEITGEFNKTSKRLYLNLTTGTNFPDYKNIACQLEVDFSSEKITLNYLENGNKYTEEVSKQTPSQLLPDSEFKFIIKVRVNVDEVLDIFIGQSNVGSIELKHQLQNITFLTLSSDITKVEVLHFRYA